VAQEGDVVWFEEIASQTRIDWTYHSGAQPGRFWFPTVMNGGAALLDYDGDGDLDLYLVQSGHLGPLEEGQVQPTNELYRNDGDWKFTRVTGEARVGDASYGSGVACGDYDQDGDVDLYVTNVGPNVLYQNQGDGTFKDVTSRQRGADDAGWGTSVGFLDADLDGDLDIFVVNNLNWGPEIEFPCVNYRQQPDYCAPINYNAKSTDTFLQYGRMGFAKLGGHSGLELTIGNGLGVSFADFDRDGDLDIYVANDASENALWRNDSGRKLGRTTEEDFVDVALRHGCAVNSSGTPEASMGVQWVDINQDGWLDIFMAHIRGESNTFYLSRKGRYRDRTPMMGIGPVGRKYTGFGMAFHDYNLDGILDLYVANGAVQAWGPDEAFDPDDLYAEDNHLFQGLGGVRFKCLGEGTPSPVIGASRGAAFGDIDNDGDVDFVIVERDNKLRVMRNIAPREGTWLGLRLLNRKGAEVIGAVVRLTTSYTEEDQVKTMEQWRLASPVYSYLSSNDPRVHFGVPEGHEIEDVSVIWPGRTEFESHGELEPGEYYEIRQGQGK